MLEAKDSLRTRAERPFVDVNDFLGGESDLSPPPLALYRLAVSLVAGVLTSVSEFGMIAEDAAISRRRFCCCLLAR